VYAEIALQIHLY